MGKHASFEYLGSELELFKDAVNWKRYYSAYIRRHTGSKVLEVGAGIGGTTRILCQGHERSWLCLEPDEKLYRQLSARIGAGELPPCCMARHGSLSALADHERFDTILYVDVLEHIDDDRAELERAAEKLDPGGRLIVLAPAHQWLFSPFDARIGHYRRYTARSLQALAPSGLTPLDGRYLDACGIMLSLANRALLRKSLPSRSDIRLWDRMVVPVSRLLDPLFFHRLGKTVVQIWSKDGSHAHAV